MVKSSSTAFVATAALLATVRAGQEPICKVVTVTETGSLVWIPDPTWSDWAAASTSTLDPTWGDWASTTTTTTADPTWSDWASTETGTTKTKTHTTPEAVTKTLTWSDWTSTTVTVDPTWSDWESTTTTTTVDPTWSDWESTTTTTTTSSVDPTWSDWASSSSVTSSPTPSSSVGPISASTWTTTSASESSSTTTTTTTTTTSAAAATATCPASNGEIVSPSGSCGCEFTVNCAVHATTSDSSVFWEQTSGALVDTLEECLEICNDNSDCEATLWVDDSTSSDYHHCWQVSGLGAVAGSGYAQISYKGTCSGTCAETYDS
jgi:hypothetical protein